jgi:hypothetical protein
VKHGRTVASLPGRYEMHITARGGYDGPQISYWQSTKSGVNTMNLSRRTFLRSAIVAGGAMPLVGRRATAEPQPPADAQPALPVQWDWDLGSWVGGVRTWHAIRGIRDQEAVKALTAAIRTVNASPFCGVSPGCLVLQDMRGMPCQGRDGSMFHFVSIWLSQCRPVPNGRPWERRPRRVPIFRPMRFGTIFPGRNRITETATIHRPLPTWTFHYPGNRRIYSRGRVV